MLLCIHTGLLPALCVYINAGHGLVTIIVLVLFYRIYINLVTVSKSEDDTYIQKNIEESTLAMTTYVYLSHVTRIILCRVFKDACWFDY